MCIYNYCLVLNYYTASNNFFLYNFFFIYKYLKVNSNHLASSFPSRCPKQKVTKNFVISFSISIFECLKNTINILLNSMSEIIIYLTMQTLIF